MCVCVCEREGERERERGERERERERGREREGKGERAGEGGREGERKGEGEGERDYTSLSIKWSSSVMMTVSLCSDRTALVGGDSSEGVMVGREGRREAPCSWKKKLKQPCKENNKKWFYFQIGMFQKLKKHLKGDFSAAELVDGTFNTLSVCPFPHIRSIVSDLTL